MATVWARAEVEVDVDGRGIPQKVRAIAQVAGDEGGKAAGKSFSKSFSKQMDKESDGMTKRLTKRFKELDKAFKDVRKSLGHLNSGFRSLPHGARQAIFWTGLIISSMSELATLSSAVGGGIIALGGVIAAFGVGLGATISAFLLFTGDIEKVPEEILPARKAFDEMRDTLSELNKALAIRAFKGTEKAWKSLSGTIKKLIPSFEIVGDVINGLIMDFAENTARLSDDIGQFVRDSAKYFDKLVRAAGKVAEALLLAFNNPATKRAMDAIVDEIDNMSESFLDFTKRNGGKDFERWMDNASSVLGNLWDLFKDAGGVLNDLVDQEAVDMLNDFIDDLDRFITGPGANILEFAKQLNIFGIIAEALADFGEALEPLAEPMIDLADAISDVLMSGIDSLAPIIQGVAEALAPFVQALADFMKQHPQEIATAVTVLVAAFALWKGINLATTAADMLLFSTSIGKGGKAIKTFDVGKLKKIGGGLAGLAAAFAVQLIPDDFWDQFDIESNLPQNVLTGTAFGAMFGAWGALIGAGLGLVYSLFTEFEATFNDTGNNIITAIEGPWAIIPNMLAEWFASLVPEEWKTSENPMKQAMAMLADAIQNPGTFITELPTMFQTLWDQITSGANIFVENITAIWNALPGIWQSLWATLNNPEFWFSIADSIGQWAASLIDGFRLWLANLALQWGNFWRNLPTVLAAAWGTIMSTLNTWWTTIKTGFIVWFGNLLSPWVNFWNGLVNHPKQTASTVVGTIQGWFSTIKSIFAIGGQVISSAWSGFWNGLIGVVSGVVNTVIGIVNRLFGPIGEAIGRLSSLFGAASGGGGRAASGALVLGPSRFLVGEAGPEAIVPLNRSLSQVDPSVRGLSAIAQGKSMASGGTVGANRVVTIAPGAVQVFDSGNARQTAYDVLDVLAHRIAG